MIQRADRRGKVRGLPTRHFVPRRGERALRLRSPFLFSPVRHAPRLSPSRHLRSCLTPSPGPVSPAPVTDSPAFQPLHSLTRSASGSGLLSLTPTTANWRDRQKHRAHPLDKNCRWPRASPASRIISARGVAYRRKQSNRHETVQLFVAPLIFRSIALRSRALHS